MTMQVTSKSASLRKTVSYLIFPTLMVMPLTAAFIGLSYEVPHLAIILACMATCLALQLVLERVMPFRRQWNERRKVLSDVTCMGLGAITNELVEIVVLAAVFVGATSLSEALGSTIWPRVSGASSVLRGSSA